MAKILELFPPAWFLKCVRSDISLLLPKGLHGKFGGTDVMANEACMCLSQTIPTCAEGRKPRAVPNLPAERLQSPRVPAARAGGGEGRLALTPRHKCIGVPVRVKVVAQLFVLGSSAVALRRKI